MPDQKLTDFTRNPTPNAKNRNWKAQWQMFDRLPAWVSAHGDAFNKFCSQIKGMNAHFKIGAQIKLLQFSARRQKRVDDYSPSKRKMGLVSAIPLSITNIYKQQKALSASMCPLFRLYRFDSMTRRPILSKTKNQKTATFTRQLVCSS